ncbi:unnamed protein product [Porites evermanni]|uniref:Immunoglobulin subtype domain-containing protein n=1 Tax=Porites evermanni TaxID=104178 RepID=A0ABN8QNR9_9CNID|nr:unnamed protein product [Porites evermanni]
MLFFSIADVKARNNFACINFVVSVDSYRQLSTLKHVPLLLTDPVGSSALAVKPINSGIVLYDGKRTYDPVLGVFTGTRQPFLIQTSGRFMMLTLNSWCWSTLCIFKGAYYTTEEKPRIRVPLAEWRTVPNHYIWFLLEGTPPINLTLVNTSTSSEGGFITKGFQINRTGTYKYTLLAENNEGNDSKTVDVTVLDCNHWCRSTGSITYGQVTNEHNCSESNITHDWNCIPTTTTKL